MSDLKDAERRIAERRIETAQRECHAAVQILLRLCEPLADDVKERLMWARMGGPYEGLMMDAHSVLVLAEALERRASKTGPGVAVVSLGPIKP